MSTLATWKTLIARLGDQVRDTRRLLGLSQQELADAARTSQGAISRIEAGRQLNIPLMTVVKVLAALAAALPAAMEAALSPDVERLLLLGQALRVEDGRPPHDPDLHALLQAYQELPAPAQRAFVEAVVPLAQYIAQVAAPSREDAA